MYSDIKDLESHVKKRLQKFGIADIEIKSLIDILDSCIYLSKFENNNTFENEVVKFSINNSGPKAKYGNISNIKISIGTFLSLTALGAFTGASAISEPWLIPFAFIILFQEIKNLYEIYLDKETALVLYSLVRINRIKSGSNISEILESMEYLSRGHGHSLSDTRIQIELSKLVDLGILEKSSSEYL